MVAAGIAMAVISAVDVVGQNVKTAFFDKIVAALTTP
jgi:Flp pilus assembly pilin Flp